MNNQSADQSGPTPSNLAGVVGTTAVGLITVLVRELVRTGALDANAFLSGVDALASIPMPEHQSAEDTRIEKRVFDLVRLVVKSAQQGDA